MLAFPNASGPVFRLTEAILEEGFAASRTSPRLRIILPLHRDQAAPVQRMLNFFQPGTYVRPHVHPDAGQSELVQVLRGRLGFLLFDSAGAITGHHELVAGPEALIDIEPGQWHGMVCLAPDTVIVEVKKGPYSAVMDKTFADWAPEEGDLGASDCLRRWESLFLSASGNPVPRFPG
jgi:cupin fold WbuC family metalloprotein